MPDPLRIAVATCAELPEPDPDEVLLLAALEGRGHEPELIAWDLPVEECGVRRSAGRAVTLERFDLCVIRSTWNYFEEPERFRAWLREVAGRTALWNPLETCLGNIDKRYLLRLEDRGVPIVPTWFIERGEPFDLRRRWGEVDWDAIVVKPVISAGSFETHRFERGALEDAVGFLGERRDERAWMVQRYEAKVETVGECAIVCIGGQVSHAVRKTPRFSGDDEKVSAAFRPNEPGRSLAAAVLAGVGPTLYARVDVIEDAQGMMRLAELELLEPSLFFLQSPPGLEAFLDALEARAEEARATR